MSPEKAILRDQSFADLANNDLSGEDLSRFDFYRANLSGANLSGAKLDGANFVQADLSGANLEGVRGSLADFRLAKLDGVRIADTTLNRWKLDRTAGDGLVLDNVDIQWTCLVGVDWKGARFRRLAWNTNGSRTRGADFPAFDPAEIEGGVDCHDIAARVLDVVAPEDPKVQAVVDFILGRRFPCWPGFSRLLVGAWSDRLDAVRAAFGRYPETLLVERLDLSLLMVRAATLDGLVALRDDPLYQIPKFGRDVEREIDAAGRGECLYFKKG